MRLIIFLFSGFLLVAGILSSQPGWKTVKDKTGACQLSVPGDWTLLSTPGHAASPAHMDTTVIARDRAYKPFSEETIRVLNVDKVFENSTHRIFYSTKPNGTPPSMNYHVEAPGRPNTSCIAQISSTPSNSLEEAKKIAASLSAAH